MSRRLRLMANSLALTLLCAILVIDGFSTSQVQARALEDSALPPEIPTEGGTSSGAASAAAAANPPAEKPIDAPSNVAAAAPETVSGNNDAAPKEPDSPASSPLEPKRDVQPEAANNSPASQQEENNKPSQKSDEPQAAPPASTSAAVSPVDIQEKDLKSLLENKNDAENDLASPPMASVGGSANSASSSSSSKKMSDELPVSVIADSDKPTFNTDRFHYSLGGSDSSKTESGDKSDSSLAPKEDKARGDESDSDKSSTENKSDTDKSASDASDEPDESEKNTEKPQESSDPAAKKSTNENQAPVSTSTAKPLLESANKELSAPVAPAEVKPEKDQSEPVSSGTQAVLSSKEDAPVAKADSSPAAAEDSKPSALAPVKPTNSEDKPASEQATSQVSASVSPTSSPTPTTAAPASTTTVAPVSRSPEPKPADAPQQSAAPGSAVETIAAAAGAAVGSALAPGLASKDQPGATSPPPKAATTSTTTTTTKAPASSTTSTTRRSSTNRWSSWPTTSTSSPPSTRRRPILPSIRRRFRPYNVFPWAMPEPYSPLEPDTEPDFGPAFDGSTSSTSVTPKPKRRLTTSTTEPPSTTSKWSTSSSSHPKYPSDETDDETPTVATRRRIPEGGNKRRHHHNRHHHHHHHHRDRFNPDGDSPLSGHDIYGSHPPRRPLDQRPVVHHNSRPSRPSYQGPRRNKHHDDPLPGLEPFSSSRPQGIPPLGGFGLFNSAGSGPAGSGFDLLNPFSWIDEVTKPRPSLHNNPRPPVGTGVNPVSGHDQSFRPTPSHFGTAGRPSGQRPAPFEGEFNEGGPPGGPGVAHHGDADRPLNHDDRHRRPHGGRRPVGGGRDDYDDYYDCDGHGNHGHDYDHDYNGRPYRPPYRPTRPGRDDYDDYGSRPGRPSGGRPYNRRDESTSEASGNRETEAPTRHRESTRSGGSSAAPGERLESGSAAQAASAVPASASSAAVGPRRVPLSASSPFDTLFGSLDDDLFGGLRSSFIDSPLKAAAETIRQTNNAFDAIISSPKISLPSSDQPAAATYASQEGHQKQAAPAPQSARVIMAKVESNEPAIESTGKPYRESSGAERKSLIRDIFDKFEELLSRREQLLSGTDGHNSDEAKSNSSTPLPGSGHVERHDLEIRRRVELPPPITTLRSGIKHFLLMI